MGLFDSNTISEMSTGDYGNINANRAMRTAGVDTIGDSTQYRSDTAAMGQQANDWARSDARDVSRSGEQRGLQYAAQGMATDARGAATGATGTGYQQQAYGDIGNWLQQGPGPSVAQAQLRQQNDANVGNMMAMAASGRGTGGNAAAQQQALFAGANAGQQTNMQAAQLRAQEAQAWRAQQLQAQGMRSDIGGNIATQGAQAQQLGLAQGQLGQNVIGQSQGLAANMQQAGAQNQLNWNQLGQQNYQQGAQLRGQMTTAAQNQATQIALANQKDYQSTDASQLGFLGGVMSMGGAAMGGGGG
jgi:hypothetical protein